MKLTRTERLSIARKRLISVLGRHGVANARTIEQKISDAGPFGQRINPHILTIARNALVKEGRLISTKQANAPWFHLAETPHDTVTERLSEQVEIYNKLNHRSITTRLGQTLEIATYRALCSVENNEFFGRFIDLDAHDDGKLYKKEEPPQHIGNRSIGGEKRLDFMLGHPEAGMIGIECKNVREWLYPSRPQVKEMLGKCVALNCVPAIIARRVPYVTFKVLSTCGVIVHQVYNQLLPKADQAIADQARHKNLLGYHNIRTGNEPDKRLVTFITKNLVNVAGEAREKFNEYKDILEKYSSGSIDYKEFAARVRRRSQGRNEDHDWDD